MNKFITKTLFSIFTIFVLSFIMNLSITNKAEARGFCVHNGSANTFNVHWRNKDGVNKYQEQTTSGFQSCWKNPGQGVAHIKPAGAMGALTKAMEKGVQGSIALIHGECNKATNDACDNAGTWDAIDSAIRAAYHRMSGTHTAMGARDSVIAICGAIPNIWYKEAKIYGGNPNNAQVRAVGKAKGTSVC